MAKVINNNSGRSLIKLSSDDVISIVREYQNLILKQNSAEEIRNILENYNFYLPSDV